jgi:uncharacterized protein (DUF983 family)
MLRRGLMRRCANCGSGHLFRGWFRMVPDCPRCGLHFEKEPGYWVGAVAINTIVVFALFAVVLVVYSALTIPDIPWVPLLVIEVVIMAITPAVYYPFSKTTWVAVDRAFLAHL